MLYISFENRPKIALCIMTVYVPLWLKMKTRSSIVEGPKDISECIKMRSIFIAIEEVMTKVLQRNAFFVHPENLPISMAVDINQHV